MPTIEVLVGVAGSGKSTYARRKAERGWWVVVCHDALVTMLHGAYEYQPKMRPIYHAAEESLVRLAIADERPVVIDRTNTKRDARARWVALGRELGVKVVAVVFPTVHILTHVKRRMDSDPRGLPAVKWKDIIWWQACDLHDLPVIESEGFDEIRLEGEHPPWNPVDLELREALEMSERTRNLRTSP